MKWLKWWELKFLVFLGIVFVLKNESKIFLTLVKIFLMLFFFIFFNIFKKEKVDIFFSHGPKDSHCHSGYCSVVDKFLQRTKPLCYLSGNYFIYFIFYFNFYFFFYFIFYFLFYFLFLFLFLFIYFLFFYLFFIF